MSAFSHGIKNNKVLIVKVLKTENIRLIYDWYGGRIDTEIHIFWLKFRFACRNALGTFLIFEIFLSSSNIYIYIHEFIQNAFIQFNPILFKESGGDFFL